jgi:hypothetical protein
MYAYWIYLSTQFILAGKQAIQSPVTGKVTWSGGVSVYAMKAYMTVTFMILSLTSALYVVRVQLRASAVCPRPSSRAKGAHQMRCHVGLRAGVDATQKRETCCPSLVSNYESSVVLCYVHDLITSPSKFTSVKTYVHQVEENFNTPISVQRQVAEFAVATNIVHLLR